MNRKQRIIDVTEWLEEETAKQVLQELRDILNKLTKYSVISADVQRFMERLGGKKR